MSSLVRLSVAIVAIGMLSATSRPAAPDTRRFVYVKDNDTAGGETITRTTGSIRGDMVMGKDHVHYEGGVAADGTIPRLEIRTWRAGAEAQSARRISVAVGRTSVQLIERLGRMTDTVRLPARPGLLPVINPSIGLIELVVARARSKASRPTAIPIVLIDALNLDSSPTASLRSRADTGTANVTFLSADTVMLGNARSRDQMRLLIGADGRSRGAASGTTATDHFAILPTSKPVPQRK